MAKKTLSTRVWERADKLDTVAKWVIFPWLAGEARFSSDKEPVQIVEALRTGRHRIAHPKPMPAEPDLIIRHKNGQLERDVPRDRTLADADHVYQGGGKLLDEFNAKAAQEAVNRTWKALRQLKDSTSCEGLD